MDLINMNRSDYSDRIFHIPEIQEIRDEEATKTVFFETDYTIGMIWTMKPGQSLEIHSHEKADDTWIVLEGEADYYPELDKKVQIKKGDVVLARAGEKHGMTNNSDETFIMVCVAGPVPTGFIPHGHEQGIKE